MLPFRPLKGCAIRYIDQQTQLDALNGAIEASRRVTFDTEFLREKTYYPKLCLMQVGCDSETYLVDPLTDNDLASFWDALLQTELVLHSCRQDLEVVANSAGRLPARIFDTQVAAALTGKPAQIGYAKLVEAQCGVALDKAHTRTDWSRRPLPRGVLEYAADDVRYLPPIADALEEDLDKRNRLHWLREDCDALLDPALYDVDLGAAWQRLKGFGRLPTAAQPRAMALATWREREAQQRNRPRQWIIRDASLLEIAVRAPTSVAGIADIQGVAGRFVERHGNALLALLDEPLPAPPTLAERPDDDEKRRTKAMAKAVREVAASLGLEAEILAPQRELRAAARGDTSIRALRGWREDVVGDALRALMP